MDQWAVVFSSSLTSAISLSKHSLPHKLSRFPIFCQVNEVHGNEDNAATECAVQFGANVTNRSMSSPPSLCLKITPSVSGLIDDQALHMRDDTRTIVQSSEMYGCLNTRNVHSVMWQDPGGGISLANPVNPDADKPRLWCERDRHRASYARSAAVFSPPQC